MKDKGKTKAQLIKEMAEMHLRIRELEKTEEALRKSQQELADIINFLPDATVVIDMDNKIIAWNRAMEDMTGIKKGDILGQESHAGTVPFYGERRPYLLDLVDMSDEELQAKYQYVHRRGNTLYAETCTPALYGGKGAYVWATGAPLLDADGNRIGAIESIRDITNRKLAEEALKEAHDILSKSPAVAFLWKNQEGWPVEFVTENVEALSGYTAKEFMSGEVVYSKILYPGDLDRVAQEVANINQDKDKKKAFAHQPYRILTKDGQVKWVEDRTYIRTDEKENITHHQGIVEDITDRMWAEAALRKAEREKSAILDAMSELVIYLDTDMKVIWSNRTMNHQFNMNPGQAEGRYCYEVLHKLNRPCRICPVVKAIETGKPHTVDDFSSLGKNWTLRAYPVRNGEGNLVGVVEIVTDITDRLQAEQALRESEEKYRNILENMEEAYFEVNLKGNIIFFSESACRTSGYSKSELMGMNYRQYTSPKTAKKLQVSFSNIYKTGEKWSLSDFELIRKDKSTRHMEVSMNLMRNSAGEVIGSRCIARDITERKRAEEEKRSLQERLQRAEKMEALGTLAGGVAHDLNNVLGIVIGYAELLLMDADKSSSIRPILVNIVNGGQRAAAIVQDLLTLARRGVSGREVLNLNKIIADCQQSPEFEKLSSYHSAIRVKTDLEPDLLNISGSSVHLGKTLFNLVSNATEAMPNGGILTIKTANEYLEKPIQGYDEVREGDYAVLAVSDTGEGIPAADLKRIFEPFYTKKVMGRSGTGLGLAVVWGTVKDHNGYINVQSEEGKGSIFTLYFPVTRENIPAEAAAISISEYMGKGESILIVDDVKGQRDLATGMLRKLNYNVSSVSSGEEAIAYLKEHKIDLMVLDMIMDPGMDGLDTYRKVLEIHPKQKAIIVSGFSETDRVITAQALGAGAYVRKPYVIEKLGLAVRNELDRK